jgi:hypothetical protein
LRHWPPGTIKTPFVPHFFAFYLPSNSSGFVALERTFIAALPGAFDPIKKSALNSQFSVSAPWRKTGAILLSSLEPS